MVNSFKGEVLIEDEDGKKYKFKLGMYAQSEIEEMLNGETFAAFFARHKEWGNRDVLTLFRAGFAEYHDDMTKRDVAQLMDRIGPMRCSEILDEAIRKGMPQKPENDNTPAKEDAKGSARPTHRAAKKRPRAALATIM